MLMNQTDQSNTEMLLFNYEIILYTKDAGGAVRQQGTIQNGDVEIFNFYEQE